MFHELHCSALCQERLQASQKLLQKALSHNGLGKGILTSRPNPSPNRDTTASIRDIVPKNKQTVTRRAPRLRLKIRDSRNSNILDLPHISLNEKPRESSGRRGIQVPVVCPRSRHVFLLLSQ